MRVEKTLSYFIEYIIFDRKIPMSHRVYHCNDGTCKFERIVSEVSMQLEVLSKFNKSSLSTVETVIRNSQCTILTDS